VSYLTDLHATRSVTPRELSAWHYDEISLAFREGRAALVADWPGSYHLYRNSAVCRVADRVGLALLPAGPAGVRAAYAGCHSFAIPLSANNPEGGLALLGFLTSFQAQLGEARCGAIPCRASALHEIRAAANVDSSEAHRWALLSETERVMIVPPRFAAYPKCEDAIWRAIQRAMLGSMTPPDAIRRASLDVQSIVNAHAGAG
jgi:multiple sugar transport system substrate-binding protein